MRAAPRPRRNAGPSEGRPVSAPSSGATGAQIAHDKIDRFRSLGAFGKPAYQSHVQLRAMLRAKRGERAANYFARPTYDPELGELRWNAEVPGAARAWHEMSEQEQADRALELEVVHSQLQSYARELREQSGGDPGGAASFASLLEQALRVPKSGRFLYFVGDQPVVAFWGFEDHDGASVDPAAQAPRYAAPPPAAPAAPAVAAPAAAAAMQPAERKKRPWWWWLMWLLLALLLLALLLLLPKACTPAVAPGLERAMPGASAPDAAVPALPGASAPEVRLGPDGQPLPAVPDGSAPGVAPLDAASAPALGPDGRPLEVPPPELAPSAPAGQPPQPLPDPKPPEPDTDPAKDGQPPPPEPKPGDPPAQTNPPPLPPADAKQMKLPDDPKSRQQMGFLEGDWKAGDGLMDKDTRQPVDLSFKFGKDGQGEVALRRHDGTICRGPVQGRMDGGGKLSIQGQQQIPCSSGAPYDAPKIECTKDSGGRTQCFGINADGSKYYMGMERR